MMYKYRFLFYAFLILMFGVSFSIVYLSLAGPEDDFGYDSKTTELNGVFTVYDGKVYAMVPSNGNYEVEGADPATFKVLKDSYADQQIGYDNRFVYAGNLILKGLNPAKLTVLGNNYYTDGTVTYYCARNSDNNPSLSGLGYIVQLAGQSLGLAGKPQNYWYPYVELPKGQTYQARPGFATAVSADKAYFKGVELPGADPRSIRPIPKKYWDGDVRESEDYRTDGSKVYYKNDLMPLSYNPTLHEMTVEADVPSREAYLIDDQKGMVYVDGHAFEEDKAPYRLIGTSLKHANQALFIAKDGLYFYNNDSEKIEKAADNPFLDNRYQEIAPDVFSSGNKIYYLLASEHWGRKTGLQSRKTHLMMLDGVQASGLKKISGANLRDGGVWQYGGRHFFFDDLGSSQLMPSAVYEIKDAATVQSLLGSGEMRTDDFRNLETSEKLSAPESTEIAKAVTPYGSDWSNAYYIIFGGVALAFLIAFLMRNVKADPYIIKDGYLIVSNLLFTKYRIADIDRIIFRTEKNYKGGGYGGRMQIVMKDGKRSRNMTFSTVVTLLPESEQKVIAYIHALQDQLNKEGINSVLAN
jgi:hypothetical protein